MNAPATIKPETLHTAMAVAFGEIEAATKSANNPHFKSKYADIGKVIEAIKPALIKHGLFFTQHPHPSEEGVTVETMLHHASGESVSLGSLFVPANKRDAQGFGSALTYARRYGLITAFGVPTEDDDGNAAARGQSKESAVSPAPLIDDTQWALIVQLIEASKADVQAFCTAYGIGSLKELPASDFPKAKAQLEAKLKKLTEKETA